MVSGWIVRLVVLLVILGVILIDVVSVGLARLNVPDDAQTAGLAAASNAGSAMSTTHLVTTEVVQDAYLAATQSISEKGETIDMASFTVYPNGSVHLTVVKKVSTVVAHYIPPLRDYLTVEDSVTVAPPLQ